MIDLDWHVATTDSEDGGTVTGIIFAQDLIVQGIVVRRGLVTARDIVVPASQITASDDGLVGLSITTEELEQQGDYRMHRYVQGSPEEAEPRDTDTDHIEGIIESTSPATARGDLSIPFGMSFVPRVAEEITGLPAGTIALCSGQNVLGKDNDSLGHLQRLRYNGERLEALLVRSHHLFGPGKLVPVDQVTAVSPDAVEVAMTNDEFEQLRDSPVP